MIISNNALKLFDKLPSNLVIRINAAWYDSLNDLRTIVENATHPIYLDFPSGRTKPPVPSLNYADVIDLANKYLRIEYFAFSNAEDPVSIKELRKKIRPSVKLVPKIETTKGADNLIDICEAAQTDMIMLDHEDLYVNVNHDSDIYNGYMEQIIRVAKANKIKVNKVQGIIFDEVQ